MRITTALCIIVFCAMMLNDADAWWSRRRRRRRRVSSNPPVTLPCPQCSSLAWSEWGACSQTCGIGTKTRTRTRTITSGTCALCVNTLTETASCDTNVCCPVNCGYTWGADSLCNKALKARSYPVITTQPSCNGEACPSYKENDCSPANDRYSYGLEGSWSTGANNKITVKLPADTRSCVLEVCYDSAQKVTSCWPMSLQHVGTDKKCFYFIQKSWSNAVLPAGHVISVNFITERPNGSPIDKPYKIGLHGNCVVQVVDDGDQSGESVQDKCNSGARYVVHPTNCTQFYKCDDKHDGSKAMVPFSCPPRTRFDIHHTTCVHMGLEGCPGRKMMDVMCEGDECPENMYREALYPVYS